MTSLTEDTLALQPFKWREMVLPRTGKALRYPSVEYIPRWISSDLLAFEKDRTFMIRAVGIEVGVLAPELETPTLYSAHSALLRHSMLLRQ
jgi:hypothetical protein